MRSPSGSHCGGTGYARLGDSEGVLGRAFSLDGRMLLPTEWSITVACQSKPKAHSTKSGINMGDGRSADQTKSASPSPLRLRVGAFLIIMWLLPFWALAPEIAHSLRGLSNPPSVAAVTTTIVIVQTIAGLLGLWVAGTEVKSIIKGTTMKHALGAVWSILLHGQIQGSTKDGIENGVENGIDPKEGQPQRDNT